MILDLAKTGLNIIGMDNNVIVLIGHAEVVCTDKDVLPHGAKIAVEF